MIYKYFVGVVYIVLCVKGCQLVGPNTEWEDRVKDGGSRSAPVATAPSKNN